MICCTKGCVRKADQFPYCSKCNVERLAKNRGQTQCLTPGCDKKNIYVSGFCKNCLDRQRAKLRRDGLSVESKYSEQKVLFISGSSEVQKTRVVVIDDRKCKVEWCNRNCQGSSEYCSKHAQHIRKYGEIRFDRDVGFVSRICVVKGCEQQTKSRNMCRTHYEQITRGEALRPTVPNEKRGDGEKHCTQLYRLICDELGKVKDDFCEGYRCESCEIVLPSLDAAHIVPRREGGSNEQWNRLWLCPTCHRLLDHYETLFWKRVTKANMDNLEKRVNHARSVGEEV